MFLTSVKNSHVPPKVITTTNYDGLMNNKVLVKKSAVSVLSDTANPIYDIYSSKIGFNTLNTSTKPILLLPSYISIMLPSFKQFG